jgi:hypothetical protein
MPVLPSQIEGYIEREEHQNDGEAKEPPLLLEVCHWRRETMQRLIQPIEKWASMIQILSTQYSMQAGKEFEIWIQQDSEKWKRTEKIWTCPCRGPATGFCNRTRRLNRSIQICATLVAT